MEAYNFTIDYYVVIPLVLFLTLIFLFINGYIDINNYFRVEGFELNEDIKLKNTALSDKINLHDNKEEYFSLLLNLEEQSNLKMLMLLKNNPDILKSDTLNKTLVERFNSLASFKKNLSECAKYIDDTKKIANML